jgi:hypothetical protein
MLPGHQPQANLRCLQHIGRRTLSSTKRIYLGSAMTPQVDPPSPSHLNSSHPKDKPLQASLLFHLASSDFLPPYPPCPGLPLPKNLRQCAIRLLSNLHMCEKSRVRSHGSAGELPTKKRYNRLHYSLMYNPLTEEVLLRQYRPWAAIQN